MQSRVGRDLQRYGACGERLVAGTVPVREVEKLNGGMGIEVCMVSSRGKSNGKIWCIPKVRFAWHACYFSTCCMISSSLTIMFIFKGGWELDETVEEAACRETLEEAGLEGILEVRICMIHRNHSYYHIYIPGHSNLPVVPVYLLNSY